MSYKHMALFLAALAIAVVVYWLAVPARRRPLFLLALSVTAAAVISIPATLYFLANIALVYGAGTMIRTRNAGRGLLLKFMLAWLVGNLCFFKYGGLVIERLTAAGTRLSLLHETTTVSILLPLGTSYIIFRLVHYLVESSRGNVPRGSFGEVALYVLFFPTFLAGPVDRFQRFHPQTQEAKSVGMADINAGLCRIVVGMVRKFVVGDTLARFVFPVLQSPWEHTPLVVALCVYGWVTRLYMDFAGYTDMAIGVSRLFGYTIIENFNKPFLQPNIALFWRNWHISVYTWIRDYFFLPLFGRRASDVKIYVGIGCSIIVFMLWHQATVGYLVAGIYHSVGLAVWYAFQNVKRKTPALRRLTERRVVDYMAVFLTFSFVSFGAVISGLARLRGFGVDAEFFQGRGRGDC